MEILADDRCTGKTMKLMKECIENRGVFITRNSSMCEYLIRRFGYDLIFPIQEFIGRSRHPITIDRYAPVYIDDADHVLNEIFGGKVMKVTMHQERDFKYHILEAVKRKKCI